MTTITQKFDTEALYQVPEAKVKDGLAQADNVAVIDIYSDGAWLAESLVAVLQLNPDERLEFIDVMFHREYCFWTIFQKKVYTRISSQRRSPSMATTS